MRKICVVFPGMGYHCDKPLLYYGKKLMKEHGYDIAEIDYGELPRVKEEAYPVAWEGASAQLDKLELCRDDEVVFLSKSIGTIIAARYAAEKQINARNLYCTPLLGTMEYADGNGIAFHGTSDPLADTVQLTEACRRRRIPLYTYEGGNHSIETGDVLWNIATLRDVVEKYIEYMNF